MPPESGFRIGKYLLFAEIAVGGMATVHLGRLLGVAGFSRTVALKRLHPHFAKDPDFAALALEEARLAARVRHPNVVSVLDVVATSEELLLVMDYVQGEALSLLLRAVRAKEGIGAPPRIAASILSGVLYGLHAAHEARSEQGTPLTIVHRDVSPQNILVGVDGVARVADFGIARAANRAQRTPAGMLKGKLRYMAPEQLRRRELDRRTDIYAASVVLWEALAGRALVPEGDARTTMMLILEGRWTAPSRLNPNVPTAVDAIVLKGLQKDPERRYGTAQEMALALEEAVPLAPSPQVGLWVEHWGAEALEKRSGLIAQLEQLATAE